MGKNNIFFLEVLEWFDENGQEICHRIPEKGSGEFKLGAQAIVRDSQAAVFYSGGVACDALGPGRHTISTLNIPVLTKMLSIPWGFTSPIRAEVYFVNLKQFTNLKWGTRDPVAFRDKELGLVRLRAHGICNVQVVQPVLFVNSLVGTQSSYTLGELENYLSQIVVSRLNDYMGENINTLLDLPSHYDEISEGLAQRIQKDLGQFGIALRHLYINAITPPKEVQDAIDDRSKLGLLGDNLNKLLKMKTAMALEKAASNPGVMSGGIGMGMGLLIPGLLSGLYSGDRERDAKKKDLDDTENCPECGLQVGKGARFCPHCGHQILIIRKCGVCGKNLGPKAKFCPSCGAPVGRRRSPKICSECGAANLPSASFCNMCGKEL